jgi:hypothetical protein
MNINNALFQRSTSGDVTYSHLSGDNIFTDGVKVGSGTALSTDTIFQVVSTSKASIPCSVMSGAQRTGIGTPTAGHMVYDTTANEPYYYNGSSWQSFATGAASAVESWALVSKTTTYTLDAATDDVVLCSATAGYSINVPTAVGNSGKVFVIARTDAYDGFAITVDFNGTEVIDEGNQTFQTYELWAGGQSIMVVSDGTNWRLVSEQWPRVYCKVSDNAGQTILDTATDPIEFTTVDEDTLGQYSLVTDDYNIPIPGYYTVTTHVTTQNAVTVAGSFHRLVIRRNGTIMASADDEADAALGSKVLHGTTSVTIRCESGDAIETAFNNQVGATVTINTNATVVGMEIQLVKPRPNV